MHLPQKSPQGRPIPIYIFCYHKGGSALLASIFRKISKANGWRFRSLLGKQTEEPRAYDVVIFLHSLVDVDVLKTPFIGVHLVRDPRDIIVSGYLYHRRTTEKWCVNSDLSLNSPIMFPKVPYSQQHRSEEVKVSYLKSLNGMSYQENLLNMSKRDGLLFEMNNYGAWTIESMQEWNYNRRNILELKFEDLMNDYDNTFRIVFEYLGFTKSQVKSAMIIATKHDLRRKSDSEIELMKHVSSKKTSKWKDYFEEEHKEVFKKKFSKVLVSLGYEADGKW